MLTEIWNASIPQLACAARAAATLLCALCAWEDDGQDDPHADEVWGGPNHGYSLAQARENFRQFLIMYEPAGDRRIGGADSDEERAGKRALMEAFDRLEKASGPDRSTIVAEVHARERALERHLKRRIREYEAGLQ
jgi:hypothetical protein